MIYTEKFKYHNYKTYEDSNKNILAYTLIIVFTML